MNSLFSLRILVLSLFTLNFFAPLNAQKGSTISGIVVDDRDSLLLGNVLLLNVQDSSLIRGAYIEEGVFSIENITENEVFIKIRSRGYFDSLIYVSNVQSQAVHDLGEIKLRTPINDLDGVEVIGKIPLFEPSPDGSTLVNVQKTMLATSASLREVLSKTPNVIVNDNTLTVFGKGEALIYLDGKQISFERMEAIQVNQVAKIQVITSPSAKYDAQGRAVVNIITVVNHSEGLNGVITQNFTQAKNFLSGTSLNVNYRKKKFSISADYGILLGGDWVSMNGAREINTPSGLYLSSYNQTEESRYANVSNYRLGLGYQINAKSNVSLEYAGNYNWFDLDLFAGNTVTAPSGVLTNFKTSTSGDLINISNSFIGNYNVALDSLGSSLFIGGQFSDYSNNPNEFIEEYIYVDGVLNNSALRNNRGSNDIQIITGQVDYGKVFNESGTLELGAKIARTTNAGKLDFFTKGINEPDFIAIPELSNDYLYSELVPAAYAQFKGGLSEKVNYSIGARSEFTDAVGVSKITDSTLIDTTYFNVFPNVLLNWTISEKWNLSFNYSGRIDRPRFQSLDPFVWYQDSLTSRSGNPFLKPEITHAFETTVGFKMYSLKAGYNYSINHFRFAVLPGAFAENSVVLKPINIENLHSVFASLTIPIQVKFWNSFNTASFTLNKIVDSRPELSSGEIRPQLYLYSYNSFDVKDWFRFELMGEYIGSQNDGVYKNRDTYWVAAGVSKQFFKKKLMCQFLVNDIFRSYRDAGSYTVGQTSVEYEWRMSSNFYRLTIRYNFGKLKDVIYNSRNTGEDEIERTN